MYCIAVGTGVENASEVSGVKYLENGHRKLNTCFSGRTDPIVG
jgi:hypothetical protein